LTGEQSALGTLYSKYKQQALRRKLLFKISIRDFETITKKNCRYCGGLPSNIIKSQNTDEGEYIYNGIDRINNSLGYINGNMAPCCKTCNYMKRTMTQEYFIDMCRKIHMNNIGERNENAL